MTKQSSVTKLKQLRGEIETLKGQSPGDERFEKWRRNVGVAIEKIFGTSGRHSSEFSEIEFHASSFVLGGDSTEVFRRVFQDGLARSRALLDSLIEEIGLSAVSSG